MYTQTVTQFQTLHVVENSYNDYKGVLGNLSNLYHFSYFTSLQV